MNTPTLSRLATVVRGILDGPPDVPAFQYKGEWIAWGKIRALADSVEKCLQAAGVNPGVPVALTPRNRPGILAALLALLAADRPVMMIHSYQSPEAMAADARRKGCVALIASDTDWTPPLIEAVTALGGCGILTTDTTDATLVPSLENVRATQPAPMAPQIMLLTSGTTGPPKTISLSAELITRSMLDESTQTAPPGAPPGLLFYPLGNITGVYTTMPAVLTRRPMILVDRFTVDAWVDYVRQYRPKAGSIPPAGIQMILDRKIPKSDLESLTSIQSGAASLNPTAHRVFEQTYGIPILLSYGATEFAGVVTLMTPQLHAEWGEKKFGSVGRPWEKAKLRVVDAETRAELPPGTDGLLEVLAPRIGPDWIRTADIAMIDSDGFIFIRGRADGAINRGGFKILPNTIEEVLAKHPAVAASIVVGIPDRRLGEVPVAAVELRPGIPAPSAEDLEKFLRGQLVATHIPTKFKFVQDLPRTASLKNSLPGVRALFQTSTT